MIYLGLSLFAVHLHFLNFILSYHLSLEIVASRLFPCSSWFASIASPPWFPRFDQFMSSRSPFSFSFIIICGLFTTGTSELTIIRSLDWYRAGRNRILSWLRKYKWAMQTNTFSSIKPSRWWNYFYLQHCLIWNRKKFFRSQNMHTNNILYLVSNHHE